MADFQPAKMVIEIMLPEFLPVVGLQNLKYLAGLSFSHNARTFSTSSSDFMRKKYTKIQRVLSSMNAR